MNYKYHYDTLIDRARNRKLDTYIESHHITPKCMNGSDDKENIVELTPEEHFVAHQLLIKIYPNNFKLIHAAVMMCSDSKNIDRSKNKLYGWLRRRLSVSVSESQTGSGNSQFGSKWINNGIKSSKIKLNENLPDGFVLGRLRKTKTCELCNKIVKSYKARYCDEHRKEIFIRNGKSKKTHFTSNSAKKFYNDKVFITDGIKDKTIEKDKIIPEGWKLGRSQNKHKRD